MKKLLFVALMAAFSLNTNAQAFEQGSSVLSVGYGYSISSALYSTYENFAGFNHTSVGPIHLKYEYFVSDKVSVGISAGYASDKIAYDDSWVDGNFNVQTGEIGFESMSIGALVKVNWYWLRQDKLMMYSGIGAGYNYLNYSWFADDPAFDEALQGSITLPPIGFELTAVGAKFMFSPNFGLYGELGLGKSIVQAGVCIGFGGSGGGF